MDECRCFDTDLGMGFSLRSPELGDFPIIELQIPASDEIRRACHAVRIRLISNEELLRKFRAEISSGNGL